MKKILKLLLVFLPFGILMLLFQPQHLEYHELKGYVKEVEYEKHYYLYAGLDDALQGFWLDIEEVENLEGVVIEKYRYTDDLVASLDTTITYKAAFYLGGRVKHSNLKYNLIDSLIVDCSFDLLQKNDSRGNWIETSGDYAFEGFGYSCEANRKITYYSPFEVVLYILFYSLLLWVGIYCAINIMNGEKCFRKF
jgi:hypothetical protein